jgi:hypothetical protein
MKKLTLAIAGIALLLLFGCATEQRFYLKNNLNTISIGQTKEKVLAMFPGEKRKGGAPGLEMRSAQRSTSGQLVEVGEVMLTDGVTPSVMHWFMFEDGIMTQWGRPEDWNKAAVRYEMLINPPPGVPTRQ